MALEFKIALIGNEGVGKSTILHRHLTGEYPAKYTSKIMTGGVRVHPIKMYTTDGIVQLNIWDCAGKNSFRGLADGYYLNADVFIGVIEYGNNASISWLQQELDRYNPDVPIIICISKIDLSRNEEVLENFAAIAENNWDKKVELAFPDFIKVKVSAKGNFQLDELFVSVARKLTNNAYLELEEGPAIFPPVMS